MTEQSSNARLTRRKGNPPEGVEILDDAVSIVAAQSRNEPGSAGNIETGIPTPTPDKAGGWMPVETAPKDGTHVLVAFADQHLPPTSAHWFGPADLPGLRAGGWYLSVQQNEGPRVRPTHWMPLPPPPQDRP